MSETPAVAGSTIRPPDITWYGEFRNPGLEHSFRRETWPEKMRQQGWVCLLASLLFVLAGAGPIMEMGFTNTVILLSLFRLAVLLPGLGLFLCSRRARLLGCYPVLLVSFIVLMGSYEAVEAVLFYTPDLEYNAPFTLLIIFLFYLLLPHRLFHILIPALASSVLYVGGLYVFIIHQWTNLIQLSIFFLASNVLGGYALVSLARNNRLRFHAMSQVLELNERLIAEIMAKEQANRELAKLAVTDELTGIPNRRLFMERARLEWARADRNAHPICLCIIDIDHFKQINDTHGHHMGDAVLQELSERLLEQVRSVDTLARLGGEEFGILMPQTDVDQAMHLLDRLRNAISTTPFLAERAITTTVSLGLACREAGSSLSFEQLYQNADAALYQAKNSGRNAIRIHGIPPGSEGS